MLKKPNKEAGFTIVEILISIIVGAVLVGCVSLVHSSQSYLSENSRDLVLANAYAEGKVESLRSTGFLGIENGTTDITSELPSELSSPRSGTLEISSPSAGIKQATISISYFAGGKNQTETYTTYLGELGVGQY